MKRGIYMRIMDIVKHVKENGHACISNEIAGMEFETFKSRLSDEFGIEYKQVAEEVPNIILYYPNYYSTNTVNNLIKRYKDRLKKIYPDLFEEENTTKKKEENRSVFALDEDEEER